LQGIDNYYTPSKGRPSWAIGTTAHAKQGQTKEELRLGWETGEHLVVVGREGQHGNERDI
jgi:hypothetical protein